MIGHVLWVLWNWPNGIVLGNILASVIWAAAFEWRLRTHHRKLQETMHGERSTSDQTTDGATDH